MHIWERVKKTDITDITFIVISIIAIFLRIFLYLENRGLWSDEAIVAVNVPKMTFMGLFLPDEHYIFGGPSFFYFFTKVIILIFGNSELSVRLLPLLFSILIFPLFWQIKQTLNLKTSSILLISLIGLSPDLIYFSQEAKAYSLDPLMVSWVLLLLMKSSTWMSSKKKILYFLTSLLIIWISPVASIAWIALLLTTLLQEKVHRKLILKIALLNCLSLIIFWLCFTKGSYHDLYAIQYYHWAGPLYDSFSPSTDILKIFSWWTKHFNFAVTKILDFDFSFSVFFYVGMLLFNIIHSKKTFPTFKAFITIFFTGIILANFLKIFPLSVPSDEMWNVRLWQGFIPVGFLLITCFSDFSLHVRFKCFALSIIVAGFFLLLSPRYNEAKSEATLVSGYSICFQQMAKDQDNFDLILFQDNFLFEYYSSRFPIKKQALLFNFQHSERIDLENLPPAFITVEYEKMIDRLGDKTINGRKYRPIKRLECQEYAYYTYQLLPEKS